MSHAETAVPTTRQRLLVGLCAAFLAVQALVPLAKLIGPRPARWGWQMYSMATMAPDFFAVSADGAEQPLDVRPYVASLRADMDWAKALPPHLCRQLPQLAAVRFRYADSRPGGEHRCR
ncbi:MAG TPA: hypothetical protein VGE07_06060 [Herpetosiphonaceae bacterium]